MNDGTFTLFDGNGDAAFLEAVSKLCNPFMQGLRLLLQLKRFGASLPGYSQMDSVLPIAPIQADIQLWGLSACTFGFTRKTDWNGTAARAMAPRAAYRYPNRINTPKAARAATETASASIDVLSQAATLRNTLEPTAHASSIPNRCRRNASTK